MERSIKKWLIYEWFDDKKGMRLVVLDDMAGIVAHTMVFLAYGKTTITFGFDRPLIYVRTEWRWKVSWKK